MTYSFTWRDRESGRLRCAVKRDVSCAKVAHELLRMDNPDLPELEACEVEEER